MAVRSISDILSNSSMQTTPRSASTMAPASKRLSPVSGSVVTAAVKPTPEDPRPAIKFIVVYNEAKLANKKDPYLSLVRHGEPCIAHSGVVEIWLHWDLR